MYLIVQRLKELPSSLIQEEYGKNGRKSKNIIKNLIYNNLKIKKKNFVYLEDKI